MAKQRTKRKLNKIDVTEVIEATEAASIYIGVWAKRETTRLLNSEPIIIPTNWGFKVGKFNVKQDKAVWNITNNWGDHIYSFTSKKTAIYWCILQSTNRLNQSRRLQEQDFRLGKYTQDQVNYQYMKRRAISNNDYFTVDVCNARLAENESLLEEARNDLEKTLTSAKYLKGIWEKPL